MKRQSAEKQILSLEKSLYQYRIDLTIEPMTDQMIDQKIKQDGKEIQMLDYIPDHLGFDCEEGVKIIKLSSSPIEANYVLRLR